MTDQAARLAASGRFAEFLAECASLAQAHSNDADIQQQLGNLYAAYGFLGLARTCLQRASTLQPGDLGHIANLATLARDAGEHAEAARLYDTLLRHLPDHPVVRRNYLTGLEYDPGVSDAARKEAAQAWGQWAIARAEGARPRPPLTPLGDRPLRIGYVSADFCQHTVGLFVKDVIQAHDPKYVHAFAYSSGTQQDWVTQAISSAATFRPVAAMDDAALAAQIRADSIDVLIDLSGHTAGSRLTAFAYRPAPVMVSWLGYFSTTGLPYVDAVLLDEWHAPAVTRQQFTEPVIHLETGRFCYQAVPWAPAEVAAPPFERNGYITFGSFNNTAKLNDGVIDLWSRILRTVPDSRLLLKWRSFNDEGLRRKVKQAFAERGVAPDRIEMRGPSFHAALLKEYGDVDIALDPFPFTGGLTSCEALYMGVPVITLPGSRAVSRQTHALLHQIGLPEFSAPNAAQYVKIAAALAEDRDRLAETRRSLRDAMRASPLMDVTRFTRGLEKTLSDLYRRVHHDAESEHASCPVSHFPFQ